MAKKKATLPTETQNIAETLPETSNVLVSANALHENTIAGFDLQVNLVAGQLTSNAKELKQAVEKELQNYSVDRYIGNPDAAKKDKAFLSKAEAAIKEQRILVSKNWNKPLDEFLAEMKAIESVINTGYRQLNDIVQEAVSKEKEDKLQEIKEYFNTLNFSVVPFERILDTKWLNKSVPMKKVVAEIDAKTKQIETDLCAVENFAVANGLDSTMLCAMYVNTLNFSATITECNRLIQLKDKLEQEKASAEPIQEPQKQEAPQQKLPPSRCAGDDILTFNLSLSTWEDAYKVIGYCIENKGKVSGGLTLSLSGTKEDLFALRQFFNAHGITYTKRGL